MIYSLGDWAYLEPCEDGLQTKLCYFIVREDEQGNRWTSPNLNAHWIELLRRDSSALQDLVDLILLNPLDFSPLQIAAAASLAANSKLHRAILLHGLARNQCDKLDDWQQFFPIYGSAAYEQNNEEYVLVRDEVEAEMYRF